MKNLTVALVAALFLLGCSNWNIANQPSGARNQAGSQTSKPVLGGVNDKVQEVPNNGSGEMIEGEIPSTTIANTPKDRSDAFHINQVISAWNKQPDSIRTAADNGNIYTWKNYKPGCDVSLTSDSEGYVSKSAIKSALSQCL